MGASDMTDTAEYYAQLADKLDTKADAVDAGGGTHAGTYREMAESARDEAERLRKEGCC